MTDEANDDAAARRKQRRTQRQRQQAWYHDLFTDIPPDFTPLECVAAVKALDDEGNVTLISLKTSGLSAWEAFGMLSYALDDWSSATINAQSGDDE